MVINDIDSLYRDPILDHCRRPRNRTPLSKPDYSATAINPFCGDTSQLEIQIGNMGRVSEVAAHAIGCSINQATTSMLSEVVKGLSANELKKIESIFRQMMEGHELSQIQISQLGEMKYLKGVQAFPIRIKCALLAWSALSKTISEWDS